MNRKAVALTLLVLLLVAAVVTIQVLGKGESRSDRIEGAQSEAEYRLLVQSPSASSDMDPDGALPSGVKLLLSHECQNRAYTMNLYALEGDLTDHIASEFWASPLKEGQIAALFRDGELDSSFNELGQAELAQPAYALLRYGGHPTQRDQMALDWDAWRQDPRVIATQVNRSPDIPMDGNPMVIHLSPSSQSSMLDVFVISRGCFPD